MRSLGVSPTGGIEQVFLRTGTHMRINTWKLTRLIGRVDTSVTCLDREKRGRSIAKLEAYCAAVAAADEIDECLLSLRVAIERTAKELELAPNLPWLIAATTAIDRRRLASQEDSDGYVSEPNQEDGLQRLSPEETRARLDLLRD